MRCICQLHLLTNYNFVRFHPFVRKIAIKDDTFQKKEQLQNENVKIGRNEVYYITILRSKHCNK